MRAVELGLAPSDRIERILVWPSGNGGRRYRTCLRGDFEVCDTIEATYVNTLALGLRLPTTLAQEIPGAVSGKSTRFVDTQPSPSDFL